MHASCTCWTLHHHLTPSVAGTAKFLASSRQLHLSKAWQSLSCRARHDSAETLHHRKQTVTQACRLLAGVAPNSNSGITNHRAGSFNCHTNSTNRHIRCYSTASPSGPSKMPRRPSWLTGVQAWAPATASSRSETSSNGSAPSSHSTNGSSHASSNTSGSPYRRAQFSPVPEAQLADSSSCFDAIMVLAGGLTRDGGLPEWVHRRLDVARDLHMMQGRRPAILCVGGGTPHKPDVIAPSGHVIHEATSCANYLMATGVEPGAIFKEISSYDTVGNAYFSLCTHAIPAGWRRVAVVTSAFHMPRSRELYADIYRLAGQTLFGDPHWYSLTFLSASDEGVFDDHVYHARIDKEAKSLVHWQSVAAHLADLPAFHAWLYTDHLCYAVPRQHEFGKRTIQDQKLLESY